MFNCTKNMALWDESVIMIYVRSNCLWAEVVWLAKWRSTRKLRSNTIWTQSIVKKSDSWIKSITWFRVNRCGLSLFMKRKGIFSALIFIKLACKSLMCCYWPVQCLYEVIWCHLLDMEVTGAYRKVVLTSSVLLHKDVSVQCFYKTLLSKAIAIKSRVCQSWRNWCYPALTGSSAYRWHHC